MSATGWKADGADRSPAPLQRLRTAVRLILALLRELADENAYQRHLVSHGRSASAEEWRRFSEERLRAKYARAKCC